MLCYLGFFVVWPAPSFSAPAASLTELPQTLVANEPFLFRFNVTGLTPLTSYEMTARLRRSDSTSDQGSFMVKDVFDTSYQSIGLSDSSGSASGWVWLKPGTATSYSAIRLRFRVSGSTATPSPLDTAFIRDASPITSAGSVSGAVFDSSHQPLADGLLRVTDTNDIEVAVTLTDSTGHYLVYLVPGDYRLQAFDGDEAEGSQTPVTVAGGQSVTINLDPAPSKIYPNAVFISELLPNPIGSDADGEFVEIENTGSEPIDLTGWKLTDASGGSYQLTGSIEAGSFLSVPFSQSKLTLNNSNDAISLTDPNLKQHDSVSYAVSPEGESWARDGEDWRWSSQPTPGGTNVFPLPPQPPELPINTIAQLRTTHPPGEVSVEGIVTAQTDLLGKHIAYIQDATGGIQIYSSALTLAQGEEVQMDGVLSSFHNELRVKADRLVDLGRVIQPRSEPARLLDEPIEGRLVTVEGRISKLDGGTFTLSTIAGDVKIVLHSSTHVTRPQMHSGDIWRISGIVSQFSNKDPSSGYRLLPEFLRDFVLIKAYVKRKKSVDIPDVAAPVTMALPTVPPVIAEAGIRVERKESRPYRDLGVIITLLGIANTGFLLRRDDSYRLS